MPPPPIGFAVLDPRVADPALITAMRLDELRDDLMLAHRVDPSGIHAVHGTAGK
jgi:hypothetical protein